MNNLKLLRDAREGDYATMPEEINAAAGAATGCGNLSVNSGLGDAGE